jgi:formamidopyrimidine-DNA glycosylase
MPELPEVETVVRQLRPRLVGRTILRAHVSWPRTVAQPSLSAFCRGLSGRRIERLGRRGKYFVFELAGGRLLVGHLRMSGRLFVVPPTERPSERSRGPRGAPGTGAGAGAGTGAGTGSSEGDVPTGDRADWVRASFDLDDGARLLFADVRKFGRLALVQRLEQALPPMGPEPLSDEVDAAWMIAALRARRRRLKPLLLDQSFLAGLGNIYVDEALHRAGLHPLRVSDRVPPDAARRLVRAIRAVLRRAIAQDGSSFDTFYRTPEGKPGRFQDAFCVYGRAGLPCRTCGATVRRIVVAQRGTHLCPQCQVSPRSARPAGRRAARLRA